MPRFLKNLFVVFYVGFNSQGHIATCSLQVEETSAYCTVNHLASAINSQLSNIKRPAKDSNRQPQSLEERTLTASPPSPLMMMPRREWLITTWYIILELLLKSVTVKETTLQLLGVKLMSSQGMLSYWSDICKYFYVYMFIYMWSF